jgi:hypothetical protein
MDTDPDIRKTINGCKVFHGLDESVRAFLTRGMVLREYDDGATILRQGEPGEGVFLISSGAASVVLTDEWGQKQELARIGEGDVFGEMSLITKATVSADVMAKGPLRVLHMGVDEFRSLATEHPEVGIALTYLIADRLGTATMDGLGGKVLDHYRIERCIGRGNMAVVYKAHEVDGERPVALKMMSHRLVFESGALDQFQREADVLLTLEHDNIASHRNRFEGFGTNFLALEYCDGQNLTQLLKNHGAIPEKEVKKILGHLCAALHHIYERDVLHRDLKPSNVMTTRTGEIKLTDFGLARPETSATDPDGGKLVGTPVYMAPEMLLGAPTSRATDLYALGCMMYELLAGKPPFVSTSFMELIEEKNTYELTPAKELAGGISRKLHKVLAALLAREPEERSVRLDKLARWKKPLAPEYAIPPVGAEKTVAE